MVYYNDNDPFVCLWLRELMKDGRIPEGKVDEKSIKEIQSDDLTGFKQCHFFAGIGGWAYALKLAGWPTDAPVWTGSCPCQPLSGAGKRRGEKDERHLWPVWFSLIEKCRPPIIFGEQVASNDGREWLSGVRTDLESLGYAVGGADLCAAGEGAPQIRQRLYWVAISAIWGLQGTLSRDYAGNRKTKIPRGSQADRAKGSSRDYAGGVVFPDDPGSQPGDKTAKATGYGDSSLSTSFWSNSLLIPCADGKQRRIPVEPEIFPLAHGIPNRVGLLRGAGNSICPEVAAKFIRAVMEIV
jgi:DNA (cytosine-5)-methyltransferase 1